MLRLHFPLIEPDLRISRIRLSDKDSRLSPTEVVRAPGSEANQAKFLMKELVGILVNPCADTPVLGDKPLTDSPSNVEVDVMVGFAHRTAAEVICPALEHVV